VSQPECALEKELGAEATERLTALLNEGPFELQTKGRNKDQYGRLLRTVYRGGESLGDMLVSEGLAEVWKGRRSSWCGENAVVLTRASTSGGSR
jgi:endonuclease YncB( thermonuclease family)